MEADGTYTYGYDRVEDAVNSTVNGTITQRPAAGTSMELIIDLTAQQAALHAYMIGEQEAREEGTEEEVTEFCGVVVPESACGEIYPNGTVITI